jgi:hypothetical protein
MKRALQPFVDNGRHAEIRSEMRTRAICCPEHAPKIAIQHHVAPADRRAHYRAATNGTRGRDGIPPFANNFGIGEAA